jgi:cob(I)alamin adenosyltransferase
MGHRLSKIYTRTGDDGSTGLGDGTRVEKDAPRVEAYGTVDELNSLLGLLVSQQPPDRVRQPLLRIQNDLFDLGGELSIPGHKLISKEHTQRLEETLDSFNDELPALKEFSLPGGNVASATCHVARAVCRRAERRVVTLARTEHINTAAIMYLNRLSDLLFVLARALTKVSGDEETLWERQHER